MPQIFEKKEAKILITSHEVVTYMYLKVDVGKKINYFKFDCFPITRLITKLITILQKRLLFSIFV